MFSVFIGEATTKRRAFGAGEVSAAHPAVLEGAPTTVFFRSSRRAPPRRARRRVLRRFASGPVMARAVRVALCAIYALAFAWAVLFILFLTGGAAPAP